MDCANCARELEAGVAKLAHVQRVQVDFTTGKMWLDGDVPLDVLRARVEALGKVILDEKTATPQTTQGGMIGFARYLAVQTRLALVGGGVIVLTLLASLFGLPAVIANALYVAATLIALYPIARSGVNNLRINRDFNINLLMTIAAVGALLIGEVLEAATVIFLFAVGEALEGYTADRARDSLRSLIALVPAQAMRLRRAALSTGEEIVPVEQLQVGDVILVKPGERVAMDGVVTAGSSSVDQAPITGESIPVHKASGMDVFAGTINGDGALEVRVTRLAADNTLSRIIQLVEEAHSVRAPSQRIIDQFARYYTPGVFIVALLVATLPPLFFGQPFYDMPGEAHGIS
jgi:Cd2+/Zn2+-exporting ATPase